MTLVKVCGITRVEDAEAAIAAGADWLGVNVVPSSPRWVDLATARAIVLAGKGRAELVAVVADASEADVLALLDDIGFDRVQLHGNEPPDFVARFTASTFQKGRLADAVFKAVRIGDPADLDAARAYPGLLLVDAKVAGALGGTGVRADWSAARTLAEERPILLAGGLNPENVAEAIAAVAPFGVDVASGVESSPRIKDPARLAGFVRRAAAARLTEG